jgi:hypothetical protein
MPNDFKGIMGKEVAGLPTWVWVVVVGAGIAAAYVVPRFLGSKGTNATATTGTGDASGASGLGLAVDPTTGLPYAVEGLVPGGGLAGGGNTTTPVTNPVTPPTTTTTTTTTGTSAFNPFKPILPQGTKVPANSGDIFTYQGQQYTIVAGPGGRIWGALGKMSLSQAQNTAIGPTTKVLLTAPASAYKPGAVAPPINYGQSPVYSGFYLPAWPGGTSQKRVFS